MNRNKVLLTSFSVVLSILCPILVVLLFRLMFSNFYEQEAFLPGLGHIMICILMVIVNLIINPITVTRYYNQFIDNNPEKIIGVVIVIFSLSIAAQIILSILIENPFREPHLPEFPM